MPAQSPEIMPFSVNTLFRMVKRSVRPARCPARIRDHAAVLIGQHGLRGRDADRLSRCPTFLKGSAAAGQIAFAHAIANVCVSTPLASWAGCAMCSFSTRGLHGFVACMPVGRAPTLVHPAKPGTAD
ncbi:hypothetical protein [Burkholderia territorii]|uniref:hypothetical protein n=1 Tax=Burkholderia territorii TaxID=1503055 RepID=UPI000AD73B5E|nr:hypothetical protein [Burkholderia territorii]